MPASWWRREPVEEIGRRLGRSAIIRFRLPAGVPVETIAAETRTQVETAGDVATIRVPDAQPVLYRLTAWAAREDRRLEGLEALRPRLEDMFLELTASEGPAATATERGG